MPLGPLNADPGAPNVASSAGPPSPAYPQSPVPAIPRSRPWDGLIDNTLFPARRIRYIVPSLAISIDRGAASGLVSRPPSSGVDALSPVPAKVEITPVRASI